MGLEIRITRTFMPNSASTANTDILDRYNTNLESENISTENVQDEDEAIF